MIDPNLGAVVPRLAAQRGPAASPLRATATASPASPPALRAVATPPKPRHVLSASEAAIVDEAHRALAADQRAEDQAEASALWRRARAANRRSK